MLSIDPEKRRFLRSIYYAIAADLGSETTVGEEKEEAKEKEKGKEQE